LVGIVILLASLGQTDAYAQTDNPATPPAVEGTPTAEPIWFILAPEGEANGNPFIVEIDAGESMTLTLEVGNGSSTPVSAMIYAADVFSDVNGGFVMKDVTDPQTGTTTWLDLKTETRDFGPREGIKKQFTITVPEGTPPGEYVTGLAVETADATAISGSPLLQSIRLATGVLITVPGPLEPEFTVSDLAIEVAPQVTILSGTVANAGNVRVRPEGMIALFDATGTKVVDAPIKMNSVYPHDQTTFVVTLGGALPEGAYRADVQLTDPATKATASLSGVDVSAAAPAAPPPLSISTVELTPMPSLDQIVFIGVKTTLANTGDIVTNAEVIIRVVRDGELIDEHVLASSLTVGPGETVVDQPYIPASGTWEPGTYQFQVVLTTVDSGTGTRTVVGTYTLEQSIVVE
jgi:hypothetical protein